MGGRGRGPRPDATKVGLSLSPPPLFRCGGEDGEALGAVAVIAAAAAAAASTGAAAAGADFNVEEDVQHPSAAAAAEVRAGGGESARSRQE